MAKKRVRLSVLPLLAAFPGLGFRTQSEFQGAALVTGAVCTNLGVRCDRVGPHQSGSPSDTRAVAWIPERMKGRRLQNVHTEIVLVPHCTNAITWK